MNRQYLLDSNTVSDLYNPSTLAYDPICRRLASLKSGEKVYVSILTLYELEYGFAHAPDNQKMRVRQQINQVQQDFEILPLSKEGAKLFGILKQILKETRHVSQENLKKHTIDVMMATTAVTEDCVLVSADKIYLDLQRSYGLLNVENWSIPR